LTLVAEAQADLDAFYLTEIGLAPAFVTFLLQQDDESEDLATMPAEQQDVSQAIRQESSSCQACALQASLFDHATETASLLFVLDAGHVLSSQEEQLLLAICKSMGFSASQMVLSYIAREDRQTIDSKPSVMQACCRSRLDAQIKSFSLQTLVCLGKHAAEAVLNVQGSLLERRKKAYVYQTIPVLLLPSLQYVLQHPQAKRHVWESVVSR